MTDDSSSEYIDLITDTMDTGREETVAVVLSTPKEPGRPAALILRFTCVARDGTRRVFKKLVPLFLASRLTAAITRAAELARDNPRPIAGRAGVPRGRTQP